MSTQRSDETAQPEPRGSTTPKQAATTDHVPDLAAHGIGNSKVSGTRIAPDPEAEPLATQRTITIEHSDGGTLSAQFSYSVKSLEVKLKHTGTSSDGGEFSYRINSPTPLGNFVTEAALKKNLEAVDLTLDSTKNFLAVVGVVKQFSESPKLAQLEFVKTEGGIQYSTDTRNPSLDLFSTFQTRKGSGEVVGISIDANMSGYVTIALDDCKEARVRVYQYSAGDELQVDHAIYPSIHTDNGFNAAQVGVKVVQLLRDDVQSTALPQEVATALDTYASSESLRNQTIYNTY